MSNIANESQEDEHITVSKIYETLKSGPFLKKLYWDVLSDIKEKDTFKQMKKTTEKLLNKKSEDLANLSDSESDNLLRKTIVAEICSMTYAIDTVYSKILFIKLQKEFKTQIIEAIKDLRQERKIPDSVWSKLQISNDAEIQRPNEIYTAKSNSLQQRPETSGRPVRTKRRKITSVELATKNREIRSEIHEDLKAINSEDGKGGVSRKNTNTGNQAVRKKHIAPSVKNISKKKQAEENQKHSKLPNEITSNTIIKTSEEPKVIAREEMQFDNPESDAESEISVGHVSLASVSSVHTSDLSSFDDEISLSSVEGESGTKRKMSLKELNEMCNKGLFSSRFNGSMLKNLAVQESSKENTAKEKETQSSPDKADSAPESADSSTEAKSPSQKTLPKRIRKPNSKYSSDNILCTIRKVKERKKQTVEIRNSVESSNNVQNSSDPSQIVRRRARSEASDSDADTPSKIMKIVSVKEEIDTDSEVGSKPIQQSNPSELYKPQFAVRSLTSRRTAPVTLYST